MNLHEYQSKMLFDRFGIPIPSGKVASSVDNALAAADSIGGSQWMVKAQVHAGGRGKAGGIVLANNRHDIESAASRLLGSQLRTHQSGGTGLPINQVLIEAPTDIQREIYLAMLVDRKSNRMSVIASSAGGMNIEEVAATTPEKILAITLDPIAGLQPFQCRQLAFGLELEGVQQRQLQQILLGMERLFIENDASLVEINPLVVNSEGNLLALDAKINLDDNALWRQKSLAELRDQSQEDPREAEAMSEQLNYVALEGSIGCMVNGAGLAMATMDLVKLKGGEPANFLDVGGTATADRVAKAFRLILSDDKVRAVLVNIFGGIVRCDLIADGILQAMQEVEIPVPVIVRLEGTNAEIGLQKLQTSDVKIETASGFAEAASMAVAAASTNG